MATGIWSRELKLMWQIKHCRIMVCRSKRSKHDRARFDIYSLITDIKVNWN